MSKTTRLFMRIAGAVELERHIDDPVACEEAWNEVSEQISRSPLARVVQIIAWLIFFMLALKAGDVAAILVGRLFAAEQVALAARYGASVLLILCVPIAPIVWARRRTRRAVREYLIAYGHRVCVRCGYDLRGQLQVEGRCPECGEQFDEASFRMKGSTEAIGGDAGEQTLRQHLESLAACLRRHGDEASARWVVNALAGSEDEVRAFLESDELWGGVGSIADQGDFAMGRESRREVEAVLIRLGEQQLRAGIVNPRTASTIEVLRQWQRDGI